MPVSERPALRGLLRRAAVTLPNLGGTVGIAAGGTGATTASAARTNLGLGSIATLAGAAAKWTPTLTNAANLDGSTAYECLYIRVGSIVVVAGRVDADPTLAATETKLGISLPVASNFAAIEDAAGVAFCPDIAGQGAAIHADITNDRLEMEWQAGDVTNQPMYFVAVYEIL